MFLPLPVLSISDPVVCLALVSLRIEYLLVRLLAPAVVQVRGHVVHALANTTHPRGFFKGSRHLRPGKEFVEPVPQTGSLRPLGVCEFLGLTVVHRPSSSAEAEDCIACGDIGAFIVSVSTNAVVTEIGAAQV